MSGNSVVNLDGEFSLTAPKMPHGVRRKLFPYKRSVIATIFLGLFLAGFSAPYFFAGEMIGGPEGSLFRFVSMAFIGFFMLGWSVGVFFIAVLFFGQLFGREVVYLSPGRLAIRMELFGAGLTRHFRGDEVKNLERVEPDPDSAQSWRGNYFQFEFGEEFIQFGSNIDRRTAELFIEEFQEVTLSISLPPEPEEIESNAIDDGQQPAVNDEEYSISAVALIVANVLPLLGVLLFDWSVGHVMLLYWFESGVVGIFNLAKMWVVIRWGVLFLGVFFIGHYGGFMAGHLFFIYGFFIEGGDGSVELVGFIAESLYLIPAVIALFISHGVSFYTNFLGKKEYEGKDANQLMSEPYRRIIVMHLTIIFGGFLTMVMENALPALILMIILKIGADLKAHASEHDIKWLRIKGLNS